MLGKMKCKTCGGVSFTREYHTASGDLACTNCGSVMEENPIVSEVTFAENAAGAATVQGSYVSNDQSHATFGNGRGSLESREQTIQNGKRRIRNVALVLGIPEHISDSAHQWFKLALTNNFVQGRRSQNVIAACLYIACRKYNTHHMLIDFSSRLQVSVYAIGATFLKMVKALHITDLPLVDPSLFIQHFADKLEFGNKTAKVIDDAKKLARRMSDDWIHEGRRPAGIAGACLLLAARMNNFRRTHLEIVAVTHIGSQTIQKRLQEFKKTTSSDMTVDEFRKNKAQMPSLPPSFNKVREKQNKIQEEMKGLNNLEENILNDPILGAMLEDANIDEEEIQSNIRRIVNQKRNDIKRQINKKLVYKDGVTKLELDDENEVSIKPNFEGLESLISNDTNDSSEIPTEKRGDRELLEMIEKNRPKNLSLFLPTTEDILKKVPEDDEELDKLIDDEELQSFILTKEESEMKERLWVGLNQDFLLQQEQKRLKLETDKIAGHTTQTRKRRKKNENDEERNLNRLTDSNMSGLAGLMRANLSGNSSASDNAKSLLTSKTLSKKINYSAVNNLFDD